MSNLHKSMTSVFLVAVLCGFAGVANAQLAVDPTSHDFMMVDVGMSATHTFIVTSEDGSNGEGSTVAVEGAGFSADVSVLGASGMVVVTFAPTAAGEVTGTLTISTDGGTTETPSSVTADLAGEGVEEVMGGELCDDMMMLVGEIGRLEQFLAATGADADIAGDGLAADYVLAIEEFGGCNTDSENNTEGNRMSSQEAYNHNLIVIRGLAAKQDGEGAGEGAGEGTGEGAGETAVSVSGYEELLAALTMSGAAMQERLQALTTEDLPIGSTDGEGSGEAKQGDLMIVVQGDPGMEREIYSGSGDFDGDGSTNAQEARNQDIAGFLARATDSTQGPACSGTLPLAPPSIGNLTGAAGDMLGLLAAVVVLMLVSVARRRKASAQA